MKDYFYSWLVALATLHGYSTVWFTHQTKGSQAQTSGGDMLQTIRGSKGQGDLVAAAEVIMEWNTSGVNIVRSE